MPDTYPPPKTERKSIIPLLRERKSIIPVLAKTVAIVPAKVRETVTGLFEKPYEPPKGKQGILTDFFMKSTNPAATPQMMADVLMGRCSDRKLLTAFVEEASVIYPEAAPFFQEKIETIKPEE